MRMPVHEARLNNAIETRIYVLNDRNVVTECTETFVYACIYCCAKLCVSGEVTGRYLFDLLSRNMLPFCATLVFRHL